MENIEEKKPQIIDFDSIPDDIEDNTEEIDQGEFSQIYEEINNTLTEYKHNIRIQAASTQPEIQPEDYVKQFFENELELNFTDSTVDDNSVMVDPNSTELDREELNQFLENLKYIFSETIGVYPIDTEVRILYYMYKVFILNFSDYFIDYILGLQDLDSNYEDDIPNYEEFSLKYFMKKERKMVIDYTTIQEYYNYIIEFGIFPELYFEIGLLGSPSNIILSALYILSANSRLTYDSQFFTLKLSKVLSSDVLRDSIVNKLVIIMGS